MCCSRAAESPVGVSAVGLHQPFPKERHRGDRKCDKNQQSGTAAGGAQVSLSQHQGRF